MRSCPYHGVDRKSSLSSSGGPLGAPGRGSWGPLGSSGLQGFHLQGAPINPMIVWEPGSL